MANKLIQYVVLTRTQFDAIALKDSTTLYFVSDTQELYRGNMNFSSAIVFYDDGERPARGAIGKLYINNTSKEGSTWNGSAWSVVIPAISSTVLDSNEEGVALPVSGVAVKSYVESVAAATLAQCVTAIRWDGENKALVYTVNSSETSIPITNLATTLSYEAATGVLGIKDLTGTIISSVNIPLDNFVTGGYYNDTTKNLVLTFQNGTTVNIPAADLVQLYHDADTNSVDITIVNDATTGENKIQANVKISNAADNAIEVKSDGLYIPSTATKMDKVGTGHEDEVIVSDATGNAAASGYKVGGSTLDTDTSKQATLLATEAAVTAVKTALEQLAEATYVKLEDVIENAADIDVDNPSAEKVISEKAMVEALSWIELEEEEEEEPAEP